MKPDSLAMLFSTAAALTFGPMKILTLDFNDGFPQMCGPIDDRLVGPDRLNAAQYFEFLNKGLEEKLNV